MRASHIAEQLEIRFEIEIEASPKIVWAKLGSLEGMQDWFARNLIFEHRVGGRFQMEGEVPGEGPYKFTGEVVRVDPPKELAFTWKPEHSSGGAWGDQSTLVTFQLKSSPGGTLVTLTHTGFEALGPQEGKQAFESHIQGWARSETLDSLKAAAESSSN